MDTEEELKKQTDKWSKKLETERKNAVLTDRGKESILQNVDAYISDSRHFFRKKDYIRSFECLIYAWGIFETLRELGILVKKRQE